MLDDTILQQWRVKALEAGAMGDQRRILTLLDALAEVKAAGRPGHIGWVSCFDMDVIAAQWQDRAEKAEAALSRVRELADTSVEVNSEGTVVGVGRYLPYAINVDGEVCLAVLMDDIRDALDGAR